MIDEWVFSVRFGIQICFLKEMQTCSYNVLSSCITADAKSYGWTHIFKRCFEDYRDAKENACCAYGNILSIPGLTEKGLHLLQFCSCFHYYILLSSIFVWTLYL